MLHALRSTVYALPLQEVIKPLYYADLLCSLVHVVRLQLYILSTTLTGYCVYYTFYILPVSPTLNFHHSRSVLNLVQMFIGLTIFSIFSLMPCTYGRMSSLVVEVCWYLYLLSCIFHYCRNCSRLDLLIV